MKIPPILVLFIVCAPIAAHAQTAEVPAVADLPPAPKSAATSDAFVWRFAPPVGSKWTMRSFSRSYNPISDGPAPHESKDIVIRKLTTDYDVLSRDALGATTIRLTLRTMTSDRTLTSDGSILKYWLSDPNSINGTTLTIKQSRAGKIWSVLGLRAFQRKLLGTDGIGDVSFDSLLDPGPITGSSDMVKALSQMAGTLPTSAVRVGESWNYNMSSPQSLALDIGGTRTLKSLDSKVAVVADSVSYRGGQSREELANISLQSKSGYYFTSLDGSIRSVSRVQRSSGLPLESTTTQIIKGGFLKQTLTTDGIGVQNESVPLDVEVSTRIVLEPRG